jgi:hypothetical protein
MLSAKLPGITISSSIKKVFLAELGITKIDFIQADAYIGSYHLTSRKCLVSATSNISLPSTSKGTFSLGPTTSQLYMPGGATSKGKGKGVLDFRQYAHGKSLDQ